MDKPRKIVDEQEARQYLAAVQAEGGQLTPWARARGINARSLNAWRMALARRGVTRVPAKLPGDSASPNVRDAKLVEVVAASYDLAEARCEKQCRIRDAPAPWKQTS
jgi:hypothetical protein